MNVKSRYYPENVIGFNSKADFWTLFYMSHLLNSKSESKLAKDETFYFTKMF